MKRHISLIALLFSLLIGPIAMTQAAAIGLPNLPKAFMPHSTTVKPAKLTILEFSAPWCSSCKKLKPTVEKIRQQAGSALYFVPINIEVPASERWITLFQIESVPTYVLYDQQQRPIQKIEREIGSPELESLVFKYLK